VGAVTVAALDVAWHVRPCSGQTRSGDAAVVQETDAGVFLAVVDALGHGPEANEVARLATASLRGNAGPDLARTFAALHQALRGSLGAAAGVCWYAAATGEARWIAVGNVALRTFGAVEARLAGRDGLVGHVLPTLREESVRLAPGGVLLLLTDGIRDRVTAEEYPGLLGDSATFLVRRVVERFGRDHDDATCVALRRQR
jgi:serine/threonine protein phosphatase PrpC